MAELSPMMRQYNEIKAQNEDTILFFRVGDFYEFFGDDAVRLAKYMDLTLTGRDCGLEERVPMVGFPYHASDMYFHKISERFELVVVEDNVATPYGTENEEIPVEE